MSEDYWRPPEVTENDLDNKEEFSWVIRDGTVILIDLGSELFTNHKKMEECLKCIEIFMLNLVIQNTENMIGIVFYNTEYGPLPEGTEELDKLHIPLNSAVFLPFQKLTKDLIQKFKQFKSSPDFLDMKQRYGSKLQSNISDMFMLCYRMFQCGYHLSARTIFHFTDIDNPHASGSEELQMALKKVNDMKDMKISYELIPMSQNFNFNYFYKEILCIFHDEDMDTYNPQVFDISDYQKRFFAKDFRKRCIVYFDFKFSDELEMGVGLYPYNKKKVGFNRVQLLGESNKVIHGKRTIITSGTSGSMSDDEIVTTALNRSEMRKGYQILDCKAIFTVKEINRMQDIIPSSIRLLGFKPIKYASIHKFLKPSYFMYPDERTIKGSARIFRSLWEQCLKKSRCAICVIQIRKNSSTRYIALVPHEAEIDDSIDRKKLNDGFCVYFLPYSGEIRSVSHLNNDGLTVKPEIEESNIKLCEELIAKLKFEYSLDTFYDPKLRDLYATTEALAYETDKARVLDNTLPDITQQDSVIQKLVAQFDEVFGVESSGKPKRIRIPDKSEANKRIKRK